MTNTVAATSGAFDLEDLAFRGFEAPASLSLEEIKLLRAAVLMEEIGARREANMKLAS